MEPKHGMYIYNNRLNIDIKDIPSFILDCCVWWSSVVELAGVTSLYQATSGFVEAFAQGPLEFRVRVVRC